MSSSKVLTTVFQNACQMIHQLQNERTIDSEYYSDLWDWFNNYLEITYIMGPRRKSFSNKTKHRVQERYRYGKMNGSLVCHIYRILLIVVIFCYQTSIIMPILGSLSILIIWKGLKNGQRGWNFHDKINKTKKSK